jgi:hypothetical protein
LEPATSFVLEIVTRVNYCCKLPPTPIWRFIRPFWERHINGTN